MGTGVLRQPVSGNDGTRINDVRPLRPMITPLPIVGKNQRMRGIRMLDGAPRIVGTSREIVQGTLACREDGMQTAAAEIPNARN